MSNTVYCVWFKEHGYYAKSQPAYEWCFTKDHEKANTYQTFDGAYARGEEAPSKYGEYEIHEFVFTIEYVKAHDPAPIRQKNVDEYNKKLEARIAKDKHIGPDQFSMSHANATKIRSILKNAFGDDWRKNPEARDVLAESEGFDQVAVSIVMKELT